MTKRGDDEQKPDKRPLRAGKPDDERILGACQCRRWWKASQHPAVKEGMNVAWVTVKGLRSLPQQFGSLQFSGNRRIR